MTGKKRKPSVLDIVHVFGTSPLPWRCGRKVGRTIYDANNNLIGVMDRQQDAIAIVFAVNSCPGDHTDTPPQPPGEG